MTNRVLITVITVRPAGKWKAFIRSIGFLYKMKELKPINREANEMPYK
jgi:hypothetical protein